MSSNQYGDGGYVPIAVYLNMWPYTLSTLLFVLDHLYTKGVSMILCVWEKIAKTKKVTNFMNIVTWFCQYVVKKDFEFC